MSTAGELSKQHLDGRRHRRRRHCQSGETLAHSFAVVERPNLNATKAERRQGRLPFSDSVSRVGRRIRSQFACQIEITQLSVVRRMTSAPNAVSAAASETLDQTLRVRLDMLRKTSFRVVFARPSLFLPAASVSRSISHLLSFPPPSPLFLKKTFNAIYYNDYL